MAKHSRVVLTPEFRGSYPALIEARETTNEHGQKTGKFEYSIEGMFPEDSATKFKVLRDSKLVDVNIQDILKELAIEAWPELAAPGALVPAFQVQGETRGWPWKRGDTKVAKQAAKGKDAAHYAGLRLMGMKCGVNDKVQPPQLSFIDPTTKKVRVLNRMVPSDMQQAKMLFQGGNYFVAELNIVAQVYSGLKYLTPYLNSVRYIREGAKFGNQGGALMSRFDGVVGGESAHNPMRGMDDEIPF